MSFKKHWEGISNIRKDVGTEYGGSIPNSLLADQDLEPSDCGNCGKCPNCENTDKAVDFGQWQANKSAVPSKSEIEAFVASSGHKDNRAWLIEAVAVHFKISRSQASELVAGYFNKSSNAATDETLSDLRQDAEYADTEKERKDIKEDIVEEQKRRQKATIDYRKKSAFKEKWSAISSAKPQ